MPIEHTISQGESTIMLAERHGFAAPTIWQHAANADLRRDRSDMNILMPGDILRIPDKRLKEETKPDKKRHRYRRKGIPAVLRLQLFEGDKPRASQKYRLTADGRVYEGTTDADGILQHHISPAARSGELIIGPDQARFDLVFGHLDPVETLTGLQKRLANLGFACNPTGEMDEQTRRALLQFQRRFDLRETGEANHETTRKINDLYDQVGPIPENTETRA